MEDPIVQTDGSGNSGNIQAMMIYIDENLEARDLTNLKFLCYNRLPKGVIEKAERGIHLFQQIDRQLQNKAELFNFIAECLFHIERYDLLKKAFNKTEHEMRQRIALQPRISAFRLLMLEMAEDLTQAEFENAKFLIIDNIPNSIRNEINNFLQLCTTFEKLNRLSDSNVELLLQICKDINRNDLEEKVIRYKQRFVAFQANLQQMMQTQQPMFRAAPNVHLQQPYNPRQSVVPNVHMQQHCDPRLAFDQQGRPYHPAPTNVPKSQNVNQIQSEHINKTCASHRTGISTSQITEVGFVDNSNPNNRPTISRDNSFLPGGTTTELIPPVPNVDHSKTFNQHPVQQQQQNDEPYPVFEKKSVPKPSEDDCLPSYKMDARPRGFCLIISNEHFFKDPHDPLSKQMKDRKGSNIDMQRLEDSFRRLHFNVRCYSDLPSEDMVKLMDEFAKESHQDYDCFVCCILTHGAVDALYGSDGRTITIEDLTYGFKSIRCKTLTGKPKLFFIQACMGRGKQEGADIQRDSGSGQFDPAVIPVGSVPSEADFLLGYATVPGHVSYRSQTQGSWYITTLTKVLNRFADKCDLLSMLVKVNEEVSKAVATVEDGMYKQVPAPLVTLRKQVFFC